MQFVHLLMSSTSVTLWRPNYNPINKLTVKTENYICILLSCITTFSSSISVNFEKKDLTNIRSCCLLVAVCCCIAKLNLKKKESFIYSTLINKRFCLSLLNYLSALVFYSSVLQIKSLICLIY